MKIIRTYLLLHIWYEMLSLFREALLKLSKTIFTQTLVPIWLQHTVYEYTDIFPEPTTHEPELLKK